MFCVVLSSYTYKEKPEMSVSAKKCIIGLSPYLLFILFIIAIVLDYILQVVHGEPPAEKENFSIDYSTIVPCWDGKYCSTALRKHYKVDRLHCIIQHPCAPVQIVQGNLVAFTTLSSTHRAQITPSDSTAQGRTSKPACSPKLSSSGRICSKECSLFTIDFATITQAYVCVIR